MAEELWICDGAGGGKLLRVRVLRRLGRSREELEYVHGSDGADGVICGRALDIRVSIQSSI